ncbi:hypothetical protein Plhal304r1_c034g0107051 [Plasmopara halstedii]
MFKPANCQMELRHCTRRIDARVLTKSYIKPPVHSVRRAVRFNRTEVTPYKGLTSTSMKNINTNALPNSLIVQHFSDQIRLAI